MKYYYIIKNYFFGLLKIRKENIYREELIGKIWINAVHISDALRDPKFSTNQFAQDYVRAQIDEIVKYTAEWTR